MLVTVLLLSILFANIFGVIFHFTYKKQSTSFLAHVFSATNESTWEHLKLAFMPMLFIAFIQHFILKTEYRNILEANTYGILLTLLLIPLLYYSIRFFLKREVVWVSILIFILSVIAGYILEYYILYSESIFIGETGSFITLVSLFLLFTIFTFLPPKIFLFKDPVTGTYGCPK